MGKKSKRNRGASKKQHSAGAQEGGVTNTSATSDVAAAAAAVGNEIDPRSSSASAGSIRIDPIGSLMQLAEKDDFEGILKLESKLVLRATALEGTEPQNAGYIYLVIADALIATEVSSKISREKAIDYLERCWKAIHSLNKIMLHECVKLLVHLYLKEERYDEAFVTMKRLTVRIPQHELIDPDFILSVAKDYYKASLSEKVIEILTIFLGTINRSWDKEKRFAAYLLFGKGYTDLAEYEKADSFLRKALTITDDPENKVTVLYQMGLMSKLACNYDAALSALNQALEILSAESGESSRDKSTKGLSNHATALVHARIGDVLSDQGNHDLEALESFERALVTIKEDDSTADAKNLATIYYGIGAVHARLGNWDEAMDYLMLAHSSIGRHANVDSPLGSQLCENIGTVRLDQYFCDERLRQDTQKRENIILEAAIFSTKSMEYRSYTNIAILNCAQAAYLTGAGIGDANKCLIKYFENEMNKTMGIYCRECNRKAGKGTDIKICRNCQVVDYCSLAHQTLAWRSGRISHKVMCPFLKRYRLVVKAENGIDTEPFEDICKDFFETVCVLKYEV
jgi:tetratricopeptide (TPR) repeat protein